ncbi:MAG: hypothetical protein ACHREM_01590 [Polyangiales bacterium]
MHTRRSATFFTVAALSACAPIVGCTSTNDTPSPTSTDAAADVTIADTTTADTNATDTNVADTTKAEATAETSTDAGADTTSDSTSETAADAVSFPDVNVPEAAAVTSATCGSIPVLGAFGELGNAACTACVNTSCCTQGATCAGNASCSYYRDCVAACANNATCIAGCAASVTDFTDTNAFSSCRNQQCNAQCTDTSCLGSVVWSTPASGATYTLTWKLLDFSTGKPVSGLTVKLCPRTDPTCATPTTSATSDASGSVIFTTNAAKDGWDSYVDITGAGYTSTIEYQWAPNIAAAYAKGTFSVSVFSTSTFSSLLAVTGVTLDSTRGSVLFAGLDCAGYNLGGLVVSESLADTSSTIAYVSGAGGLPSKTATATDYHGSGAILNVQAGASTLTVTSGTSATAYGTFAVPVRAGYLTGVELAPTP